MKWLLYALKNEASGKSFMESGTNLFHTLAMLCLGILITQLFLVVGASKVLNVDSLVLNLWIFS